MIILICKIRCGREYLLWNATSVDNEEYVIKNEEYVINNQEYVINSKEEVININYWLDNWT